MNVVAAAMKVLTDRMPRKVAISSLVIIVTLIAFVAAFFGLGGAHDDAEAANNELKQTLDQTNRSLRNSKDDRQFITENREKYEELLNGDRLIPHTQRVAATQLRNLALQRGLTNLGYTFTAAGDRGGAPAATLPASGGYRVQVEKLDLKIGAALDTQVFDFILDLGDSFPGSAVVEQFNLERSSDISTEALNSVSRGRDSGLVRGDVRVAWRTAQAQEPDKKAGAPAKGAR